MLKSENRLRKRKEFAYLYNHGDAKHTTNLTIVYHSTKYRTTKIGFSVTKKIGKAYVRNRVKRVLRAVVREFVPSIVKDYNIVFIAKSGIEELTFDMVKIQVESLLKKAELLKLGENNA
jgi:ribonuclease P protein component